MMAALNALRIFNSDSADRAAEASEKAYYGRSSPSS